MSCELCICEFILSSLEEPDETKTASIALCSWVWLPQEKGATYRCKEHLLWMPDCDSFDLSLWGWDEAFLVSSNIYGKILHEGQSEAIFSNEGTKRILFLIRALSGQVSLNKSLSSNYSILPADILSSLFVIDLFTLWPNWKLTGQFQVFIWSNVHFEPSLDKMILLLDLIWNFAKINRG